MASVWPAKNNYATGDVLTAANMNGVGDDLNDVYNFSGYAAGKNKIINGDFGIWQRGTSISLTNNTEAYTTDRFYCYTSFSAGSSSISRQTFTPGTAPVAGYEGQFFARFTAGSTSTYMELTQRIEDVRTFAGQTVTLSFWAKASTNTSMVTSLLQNFGSGGSAQVFGGGGSHSLTTSWTRFTVTVTLPSISGKTVGTNNFLAVAIASSSLTGSQTIDFWGVQLEAGSTASPFQTATGTKQGELAACQRYYVRYGGTSSYTFMNCSGNAYSGTAARLMFPNPVVMRTAPTSVDYSTLALYDGTTLTAVTGVLNPYAAPMAQFLDFTVSTGLTTYRTYTAQGNNSTSAYLALSAEL